MSVRGVLRSLERRLHARGLCRVCGGRGSFSTIAVRDGVPDREPLGCSGCGKVGCVKKIILNRRPEPAGAAS